MKKNVMMRIASVLLIAVLISTCGISGTYAKYVASDNSKDTARVAKWGVTFEVGSDLFDAVYNTDDNTYKTMGMNVSVKSNGDNVVAPGTKGDGFTFVTHAHKPEVSYKVSFKETVADKAETIFLNAYLPVKFALQFGSHPLATTETSISALIDMVEKCTYYFNVEDGLYYYSIDNGLNYTAGQADAPTLSISWNWDFSTSEANDELDTKLGNLAANPAYATTYGLAANEYNLDVAFDITVIAEQID